MPAVPNMIARRRFGDLFEKALEICVANWNRAHDKGSKAAPRRYRSVRSFLVGLGGSYDKQYDEIRLGSTQVQRRDLTDPAYKNFRSGIFLLWLEDDHHLTRMDDEFYHVYLPLARENQFVRDLQRISQNEAFEGLLAGTSITQLANDHDLLRRTISLQICGDITEPFAPNGLQSWAIWEQAIALRRAELRLEDDAAYYDIKSEIMMAGGATALELGQYNDFRRLSNLSRALATLLPKSDRLQVVPAILYHHLMEYARLVLEKVDYDAATETAYAVTMVANAGRLTDPRDQDLRAAGFLAIVREWLAFSESGTSGHMPDAEDDYWQSLNDIPLMLGAGCRNERLPSVEFQTQELLLLSRWHHKLGDPDLAMRGLFAAMGTLAAADGLRASLWADIYATAADIAHKAGDTTAAQVAQYYVADIFDFIGLRTRAKQSRNAAKELLLCELRRNNEIAARALWSAPLREFLQLVPPPLLDQTR